MVPQEDEEEEEEEEDKRKRRVSRVRSREWRKTRRRSVREQLTATSDRVLETWRNNT